MMTCISEELCYGYIQWIVTKFSNEEPSWEVLTISVIYYYEQNFSTRLVIIVLKSPASLGMSRLILEFL